VRVLIDYRPALRERSGVGEYTHRLVHAIARCFTESVGSELTVFSSSWKDRLQPARLPDGIARVDRRLPVRLLNLCWHRLGWPPIEALAHRTFDVTHSPHPLILPSRHGAHVVTVHDLNFLAHPERTRAEIRRDYPALARTHAARADRVIVVSEFTAGEVERQLGVPREHISICSPGAPDWTPRAEIPRDGYGLFIGTLEPRKNLGALLEAYEDVIRSGRRTIPPLVIAGKATGDAQPWLDRMRRPPLNEIVRYAGYVDPSRTRELYEGARFLVVPSFEEGFGIPVLEAMTLGVPVIASSRGSLPEVLGGAGQLIDPEQPSEIARAIIHLLEEDEFAADCRRRGLERARAYSWTETARRTIDAYHLAIEHHAHRH
jgi:glycosyltransferase involved in cell wall biosynthesis